MVNSQTPDTGTVTLQLNGGTIATARYGEGSTPASIAAELVQTASSNLVTVTTEGQNIILQATQTGSFSYPYNLVFTSTQPGFSQSSFSAISGSGTLSGNAAIAGVPVYGYSIANGSDSGYDAVGNITSVTDSVMGGWAYGYDSLNRLTGGQSGSGPYAGQYTCWSYDSFGNRTAQAVSATPCGNAPPATFAASYNANNQISSVSSSPGANISYDASGNVTGDGVNQYFYDAEGRLCAVHGPQGMIGYLYDADGNRVGKGTITSTNSCDPTQNGYVPTNDFVLDQSGAQVSEVAWSGSNATLLHTNVTVNGTLLASYDSQGLHFFLNDAVGTRRMQVNAQGTPEQICQSLPFGDQLSCTGSASFPTEHHFTGKERDAESGLDYFGSRYYGSSMGRFTSPDRPFADQHPESPQSWNLYAYGLNNPLKNVDVGGNCVAPAVGNGQVGNLCRNLHPSEALRNPESGAR